MIVDEKYINKLKIFGLNSYEAKIWTALLSRGVSSAGELSDISNVPRSRSYDVLESLERKGFIIMRLGKPIKYIAVPPSEVIERVKKSLKESAERKIKVVDEIKNDEILEELNLLYNKGIEVVEPTELSGAVRDRDSFYANLNYLIKNSEKSFVCMTTPEGIVRKAKALRRSLDKAAKKGVSIRFAAPLNDKAAKAAAKQLSSFAEVRHIDNVKARFCIVDGKHVAFSLMNDKDVPASYDAAVLVNTEFFANALEAMFNSVWQQGAN